MIPLVARLGHQVVVPDRQDGKRYDKCHADLRERFELTTSRFSFGFSLFGSYFTVRHCCWRLLGSNLWEFNVRVVSIEHGLF